MPPKGKKHQTTLDHVHNQSSREHVLNQPDVYIGDIKQCDRSVICLNSNNEVYKANITLAPAFIQLFKEVATNATDNFYRTKAGGREPGKIYVYVSPQCIIVRNEGDPIPNGYRDFYDDNEKVEKIHSIEMLFGKLRSSTNYETKTKTAKVGAGKNGIGCKAVNVFAKLFRVDSGNNEDGQHTTCIWEDNLSKLSTAIHEPGFKSDYSPKTKGSYDGPNYTQVEWHPDFKRFGIKKLSKTDIDYFAFMCAEFSLANKAKIIFYRDTGSAHNEAEHGALDFSFSGEKTILDFREAATFASLVYPGATDMKHQIVFPNIIKKDEEHENPLNSRSLSDQIRISTNFKDDEHYPRMEVIIMDTPEKSDIPRVLSYVNGISTPEGGGHVKAASEVFLRPLLEKLKEEDPDGAASYNIKSLDRFFSFIVIARVKSPQYDGGQIKSKVSTSESSVKDYSFDVNERLITDILKWSWYTGFEEKIEKKIISDIKKVSVKNSDTYQSANKAGKSGNDCVIYIVEGISASNYPKKRLMELEGKRDKYGFVAVNGKIPNVRKMRRTRALRNKKIQELLAVLGIDPSADYTNMKERSKLRYGGGVQILTDADTDGKHILGLLINFFDIMAPGLLEEGYVSYLATPIVRVFSRKSKKCQERFETAAAFAKWEAENDSSKYKIKYYKGLGTSEDSDIRDDVKNARIIVCKYDDNAAEILNIVFGQHKIAKGETAPRKKWISEPVEEVLVKEKKGSFYQTISNIMNSVLKSFSIDNIQRGLPCVNDGLKISQRQLFYAMAESTNYGTSKSDGDPVEIKISNVASKTTEKVHYTHGEASLYDATFNLARDYIGANNLPIFKPKGQFGTRDKNGTDGSQARYLYIQMDELFPKIYEKEVVNLVDKNREEGHQVEPLWMAGYLPMGIINGSVGIGTGWSNNILAHRPSDILKIQKNWCKDKKTKNDILPWYKGFTGTIKRGKRGDLEALFSDQEIKEREKEMKEVEKRKRGRKPKDAEEVEEDEPEDLDTETEVVKKGDEIVIITGNYEQKGNTITITEIPVSKNISFSSYAIYLDMLKENGYISDYVNKCDPMNDKVHYILKNVDEESFAKHGGINHFTLNLAYIPSMRNMYLLNTDSQVPTNYKTIVDIVETYCENLSVILTKHIKNQKNHYKNERDDLDSKMKFINYIRANGYEVSDEELVANGVDPKWWIIPVRDIKKLSLEKIMEKREQMNGLYEYYKVLTPKELLLEKLEILEPLLESREL